MNNNQNSLLNKLIFDEISNYRGLTISQIKQKLNLDLTAKNSNAIIAKKIIDNSKNSMIIKKLINDGQCSIKTITLEWNNNLKESISLKTFNYCELIKEEWDTSTLRSYFKENTFIFIIFKKGINDIYLLSACIWKMPESILDKGVKDVWEDTKNKICSGNIVRYIDSKNRNITNFLSSGDTKFIHVRPHAQNKYDTLPLPVRDKVTGRQDFMKYSFWLNSNFIKKIVVEGKYYE